MNSSIFSSNELVMINLLLDDGLKWKNDAKMLNTDKCLNKWHIVMILQCKNLKGWHKLKLLLTMQYHYFRIYKWNEIMFILYNIKWIKLKRKSTILFITN